MEFGDNELTFDMIGNMSEEEINNKLEEEVADENLFVSEEEEEEIENQEGVGNESQEDNENEPDIKVDGDSPDSFYASIANSLREDGILTLDDSSFENISTPEDLAALFNKQIEVLRDNDQKRIGEALNNNIPSNVVMQYENIISYLSNIKEEDIKAETPEAEELRGRLILQSYINEGKSEERANALVDRSFSNGSDVEDALMALEDNKDFYNKNYQNIIQEAKEEKETKLKEEREMSKKLEDKFLKTEEPIKGIKLNDLDRKKILNQYTKFVDKDENNRPINAIQKYAKENPIDYQYNINLLYHLTDGFKDIGKVVGKEVKTKTKSALSNIEKTLKNTNNSLGGGFDFGNDHSPESKSGISVLLD